MKRLLLLPLVTMCLFACRPALEFTSNGTIENRVNQENFEGIDLAMSIYQQTRQSVGIEVSIVNNSEEYVSFHPLDFYYNPSDYSTRIYAYEPDYLMEQVEDPHGYNRETVKKYREIENIKLEKDIAFMVGATLLEIGGIYLFGDNDYAGNFYKRSAKLNDYYKILENELLLPQSLAPGESLRGLIFFPKIGLKKMDTTFIKWRIGSDALRQKFEVK